MIELFKDGITGITAFVATNLDDIVILLLFFSQASHSFRRRHVFAGQYLGFTAIVLLSLPGFFGRLLIPQSWIGFVGLLPIAIGLYQLFRLDRDDEDEVQTVTETGRQQFAHLPGLGFLMSLLNPNTYQVAAVTVANGGDNIGIYLPLFASSDVSSLGIILITFYLMMGVLCLAADRLIRQPQLAKMLTQYGNAVVPFVLIGLGIYILIENETYWFVLGLLAD
ncbi:cadmium resistance transporter [Oculatella sp. LEGE 06141]|uniref:cadmium resistance transporter n=1 Tax=Oculatella sp. LEGE 06141 TaxID=1828648 RepID=UPI0018804DFE|nr:cadmium resistance transporter [Oculatella sp. LEGE 06141]